jgi:hypothetical protein
MSKSSTASPIQAIETRYAGCRFRSRLEARWAVFFDALHIEWQYEVEGYVLPDGTRYLPDFWLPNLGVLIEVKGEDPTREEIEKARLIAESVHPIAIFSGPPSRTGVGTLFCNDVTDDSGGSGEWDVWWGLGVNYRRSGVFLVFDCLTHSTDRVLVGPNYEAIPGAIHRRELCGDFSIEATAYLQELVDKAIVASTSARFEFGESG